MTWWTYWLPGEGGKDRRIFIPPENPDRPLGERIIGVQCKWHRALYIYGLQAQPSWIRRRLRMGDSMARPIGVACNPALTRSTIGDGSGGISSL